VGIGCAYNFTVRGNICQEPCEITCPANITQANDANQCGAVVNYPAPTTTGDCNAIVCSPASGSFFPVGTTTVTCSDTAARRGAATCSFTVTVNDAQPPTISCPANIVTPASTTMGTTPGANVAYAAPAVSDNCPGVGAPTCSPASGSFFAVGTRTVTCTVADAAGNSATCSFSVTVTTPFTNCYVAGERGSEVHATLAEEFSTRVRSVNIRDYAEDIPTDLSGFDAELTACTGVFTG
jgi:hypothetical protein